MRKRKTHEEYIMQVYNINPNIEVVDEYIGNHIKIKHRCKIDNYEWFAKPANILCNKGCPVCGGSIKKTHEQYVSQVLELHPNIDVLEQYINAKTKIKHKCKIDGYEFEATPNHILRGSGCPMCAGVVQKTNEQYIKQVFELNPNIEVIGEYVSARVKIKHRCRIDDYEFDAKPNNVLSGEGCPLCARRINSERKTKSHEEYIEQVKKINPYIDIIGQYVNSGIKILCKCKIDGCEWEVNPTSILQGSGCPQCNFSRGEREIKKYLTDHLIEFHPQHTFDDCRNKRKLPFDFYLPDFNVCIEYDGMQHFESIDWFGGEDGLKKQQINDEIKNKYCAQNNIKLLRIKYNQNIDKALDSFLSISEDLTNMKKYDIIQSVKETIQNECFEAGEGRLNMGGCERERKNVDSMPTMWAHTYNL